jgi:diaminopimelate decarboxylase
MKSNRFSPLLTYLKTLNRCGIDACSPGEMILAQQCGFRPEEISYTGTSLSNSDYAALKRHPDVRLNLDSLTAIRRVGEQQPGQRIGLRINPALGVGYESNELLRYSGHRTTKFGIYREQFGDALNLARNYGLDIVGLHLHTGCGYLSKQLPAWRTILKEALWFIDRIPDIEYVNVGGGLGIPLVEDDQPLNLEEWSGVLAEVFGGRSFEVWVEPGDYIAKDSGVLVLQVNSIERKRDTTFVGVDGGFNIHIEPVVYKLPLEAVPCRLTDEAAVETVTIAGNINEAMDLLAENVTLPVPAEGDYLAFLNAGGYGAAMSSNHCMRGQFTEILLT